MIINKHHNWIIFKHSHLELKYNSLDIWHGFSGFESYCGTLYLHTLEFLMASPLYLNLKIFRFPCVR